MLFDEMIHEGDERITIAFLGDLKDDLIRRPVIGSEDVSPLLLTRRWNA